MSEPVGIPYIPVEELAKEHPVLNKSERDLTFDDRLLIDMILFGVSYERRHVDGTRERIPPFEIIVRKLKDEERDVE